jgi:uncharacterized phiE125 gp8 family phage protein
MYKLVTPTTEDLALISLDEARAFLYVDEGDYSDSDMTRMISSARTYVENILQRAVLTSGWEYYQDSFFKEYFDQTFAVVGLDRTRYINIPRPNLISVEAITYFDADNTEVVMLDTEYYVILVGDFLKGQIEPAAGSSWPTTYYRKNAVKIEYTAGWATAEVPEDVRHAILIALGDLYENRQTNVTGVSVSTVDTLNSILSPYKVDNI